jgi:hypothetical protein
LSQVELCEGRLVDYYTRTLYKAKRKYCVTWQGYQLLWRSWTLLYITIWTRIPPVYRPLHPDLAQERWRTDMGRWCQQCDICAASRGPELRAGHHMKESPQQRRTLLTE